jgi:hypothetical protein
MKKIFLVIIITGLGSCEKENIPENLCEVFTAIEKWSSTENK